jgi:hypothetical protein
MKNTLNIALMIFLATFCSSNAMAQWGKTKVVGNGNVTTKNITTSDYATVKVIGSMDVSFENGSEGIITVTTDENIHEYMDIYVEDDILIIKTKTDVSFRSKKGIHVTVPVQEISSIYLVGSGDIDTKNQLKSEVMDITLTGSGAIDLDVNVGTLDTKVSGSGTMSLRGISRDLEVKVTGSGSFDGESLTAKNTEAYVSGSGAISVKTTNSLKARVHGSGDISYSGNPTSINEKISGSGSIKN